MWRARVQTAGKQTAAATAAGGCGVVLRATIHMDGAAPPWLLEIHPEPRSQGEGRAGRRGDGGAEEDQQQASHVKTRPKLPYPTSALNFHRML